MNLYDVLRQPVYTEKSSLLEANNKYVFYVCKEACKGLVKRAVEYVFNVQVKSVNILTQKGKIKKFKGEVGVRAERKKVIVTLKPDNKIDFNVLKG